MFHNIGMIDRKWGFISWIQISGGSHQDHKWLRGDWMNLQMLRCKSQAYLDSGWACLYCSTTCWRLRKELKLLELPHTKMWALKGKFRRVELVLLSLVTTPNGTKNKTWFTYLILIVSSFLVVDLCLSLCIMHIKFAEIIP